MKKIVPAITFIILITALTGCQKKNKHPDNNYGEPGPPSATTGGTGPTTTSGGTVDIYNIDLKTIHGILVTKEQFKYQNGNFQPFSRFAMAYFKDLSVPTSTVYYYAGDVKLNNNSLPFSSEPGIYYSYQQFDQSDLKWTVEGGDKVPALSYKVPGEAFGVNSSDFPDEISGSSAFKFTLQLLGAQSGVIVFLSQNNSVPAFTKEIKKGKNTIAISADEVKLLNSMSILSIQLRNDYLVPGGTKKFWVQCHKVYEKNFKVTL